MIATALCDFIRGVLPASHLESQASSEIAQYKAASTLKGSTMPVVVEGSDRIVVDRAAVLRLCDAYLSKQLSGWALQYIVDALQMAPGTEFENEATRDLLDGLTDLGANPSAEHIRNIQVRAGL